MFKALKEKYYHEDASDRLYKKSMLHADELDIEGRGKLQDHLDEFDMRFNKIVVDPVNLCKEVSHEDKALLLFNSLLPSYQALK